MLSVDLKVWLHMFPLAQGVTLTISGTALLVFLMAVGGYAGWNQGIRAVLTETLFTIIAYLTCVSAGNTIVSVINRFWTNLPRLVAFVAGTNPDTTATFDPLIEPTLQVPLFFRFLLFIALLLLGWFFTRRSPWMGKPDVKEPLARPLGLYSGALIALIWATAGSVFYQEYLINGGSPIEPFNQVLSAIPDLRTLIPSLITIFFLILFGILFISLPRLLRAP